MFMIFFLLACFILVGKALVRNSQNQIDVLTRNLGTSFVIKIDENNPAYREDRIGDGYSYTVYAGPEITGGMVSDILEIERVSDYSIDLEFFAWADLKLRPGLWTDYSRTSGLIRSDNTGIHLFQRRLKP